MSWSVVYDFGVSWLYLLFGILFGIRRTCICMKYACFTQLSVNFIQLINIKMPTSNGVATFVHRINTTAYTRVVPESRRLFI